MLRQSHASLLLSALVSGCSALVDASQYQLASTDRDAGSLDAAVLDASTDAEVRDAEPDVFPCTSSVGSSTCTCAPGSQWSGSACVDIDECALDIDGCAQRCENTPGSFVCACGAGQVLDDDKRGCRALAWETEVTLDSGDVSGFALAQSGSDAAYVAWGRACVIHARSFAGATWGATRALTKHTGCAIAPRAAIDLPDRAVAAWLEAPVGASPPAPLSVWALRYALSAPQASTSVQLDPGTSSPPVQRLVLAHVDRAGNALVLWTGLSGDMTRVSIFQAARAARGAGFGLITPLLPLSRGYAVRGDVFASSDESGRTQVSWYGSLFTHPNYPQDALFSRVLSANGAWEGSGADAFVSERAISGAAFAASAAGGAGVAIFARGNAATGATVEARLARDGTWEPTSTPVTSVPSPGGVAIATRETGDAVAVFVAGSALQTADRVGTSWGAVRTLDPGVGGEIGLPQVALDADGHAAAVWLRGSAGRGAEVWASHRPAGASWQVPQRLGAADPAHVGDTLASVTDTASVPRVCMLGSGQALAVWTHWRAEGQVDLRASRLR